MATVNVPAAQVAQSTTLKRILFLGPTGADNLSHY